MLYGDSFVYMSVLSYRGYGKIYNGKVNVLLHNYTTRAAQTFDCAAQVGAELINSIQLISIHRWNPTDIYYLPRKRMSPSSRGRGLKYHHPKAVSHARYVALFTKAWIEISNSALLSAISNGRPLHEGVDCNGNASVI